jgi:LysM repeat protein
MVPSRERPKVRATAAPEKAMPEVRLGNKELATGAASVQKKVHVVRNGDTLYAIARRYDLSVAELKAKNRLKEDLIAPGQLLYVE